MTIHAIDISHARRKFMAVFLCMGMGMGVASCDKAQIQTLGNIAEGAQLVIFSFGDSFVSGEGNPDSVSGSGGPTWTSTLVHGAEICHRSRLNAHQLAVNRISDAWTASDEEIYRNFACSGATVQNGLSGAQFAPGSDICIGVPVPTAPVCGGSQIDAAATFVDDPANGIMRVDVVILSIGVNDLGFSRLVQACASPFPVSNPITNCATNPEFATIIEANLLSLNIRLQNAITEIRNRINPKEIIIVGYPDPTRDANGAFCDHWSDGFTVGLDLQQLPLAGGSQFLIPITLPVGASTKNISAEKSEFAYNRVLVPLNNLLDNVASITGSRFVDGAAALTRNHGFCAESYAVNENPSPEDANVIVDERWFLTFRDSYIIQRDFMGSFHPNNAGHEAISHLIEAELRDALGLPPL